METPAISSKSLKRWWARQGLNLRPHPCEGCALPLSYAPALRVAGKPVRHGTGARLYAANRAFASAMAGQSANSETSCANQPLGAGCDVFTAAAWGQARQ